MHADSNPYPDAATASRYGRVAIALHWLIAALIGAQLALGWWMDDLPKEPPGLRAGWFNLHKSIGLTIGMLVLLRLLWRLAHRPPALPAFVPRWQRRAATATQRLLYVCMLLLPLSGYLGSTFTRYPVRYFGIMLPQWGGDWPAGKEAMSELHEATVWVLVVLLVLHIAGAVWHLLRRDGVFARMWPRRAS